jgi:hypothetical protein
MVIQPDHMNQQIIENERKVSIARKRLGLSK